MDAFNRPLTPPSDQTKQHTATTTVPTANGGVTSIPTNYQDNLNDTAHFERQKEALHNSAPPSNSTFSPSPANPFVSSEEKRTSNPLTTDPLKQDLSSPLNRDTTTSSFAPNVAGAFNADSPSKNTTHHDAPSTTTSHRDTFTNASAPSRDTTQNRNAPSAFDNQHEHTQKKHIGQRNTTTHRIESEVLRILQWKDPVRSGVILASLVGSILLTRWYSLLQIGSTALTLAIGINLIYVNMILQSQKVLTNQEASHPYSGVIDNDKHSMINQESVNHYSTVITELAETVIRALTRIIFVENTVTSLKWMGIFFAIWKISAHFSTMDIVLMVVISAFTFPRLYISNKDVVDAQLQKGQTMLQTGINKAQNVAAENVQNSYAKARAYVAQAGTTGTDAKNTMRKSSVTMKDE